MRRTVTRVCAFALLASMGITGCGILSVSQDRSDDTTTTSIPPGGDPLAFPGAAGSNPTAGGAGLELGVSGIDPAAGVDPATGLPVPGSNGGLSTDNTIPLFPTSSTIPSINPGAAGPLPAPVVPTTTTTTTLPLVPVQSEFCDSARALADAGARLWSRAPTVGFAERKADLLAGIDLAQRFADLSAEPARQQMSTEIAKARIRLLGMQDGDAASLAQIIVDSMSPVLVHLREAIDGCYVSSPVTARIPPTNIPSAGDVLGGYGNRSN